MSTKKDEVVPTNVERNYKADLEKLRESLALKVENNEITALQKEQIINNFIAYQSYADVANYIGE